AGSKRLTIAGRYVVLPLRGALLALSEQCPHVDIEDHKTRYRTLRAIARQFARAWRPPRSDERAASKRIARSAGCVEHSTSVRIAGP
ncbi:MAG: hypothetical protein QOD74_2313, partial [Variibacter sp.]|nr:hypothetical protein [Variibacter sp.]